MSLISQIYSILYNATTTAANNAINSKTSATTFKANVNIKNIDQTTPLDWIIHGVKIEERA